MNRSLRADVRNPLLQLPAVTELLALDQATRAQLAGAFKAISADARERANECWRRHKAPMACYWKAVAVYSGHLARLVARGGANG